VGGFPSRPDDLCREQVMYGGPFWRLPSARLILPITLGLRAVGDDPASVLCDGPGADCDRALFVFSVCTLSAWSGWRVGPRAGPG
jgi:hypothetical protein